MVPCIEESGSVVNAYIVEGVSRTVMTIHEHSLTPLVILSVLNARWRGRTLPNSSPPIVMTCHLAAGFDILIQLYVGLQILNKSRNHYTQVQSLLSLIEKFNI